MRITIAVAIAVLSIATASAAPPDISICNQPSVLLSPNQVEFCQSDTAAIMRATERLATETAQYQCVSGAHYDSAARGCVLDTYKPEKKPSEGSSPISAFFGLALLAGLFILMRAGVRNWLRGSPAPAGKPAAGRTASEE